MSYEEIPNPITHLTVVELTIDVDLTLGNVARKIGNGVGNVCIHKRESKDMRFRAAWSGGKHHKHVQRKQKPTWGGLSSNTAS